MASGWFVLSSAGSPGRSAIYHASGQDYALLAVLAAGGNDQPAVIGGTSWDITGGPFGSEAEAKSASPGSPVITGSVTGGTPPTPSVNPFADIADTAHALAGIGAFFAGAWKIATDGKMWRSLGWLLLGIVLMLAGIALWIGPSAQRMSPVSLVRQGVKGALG